MPGRNYSSSVDKYRYGFNGKENDKETVGTGSGTQDYGLRIYNPALGKFLSVDPLQKEFAWNSSYAFAENDVIRSIDLDGAEKNFVIQYKDKSGAMLWHTVPYSKIHPGVQNGPLGKGDYVYAKDPKTGQFSGHYVKTYKEANPIRSALQDLDSKAEKSAPFESVELGVKTTERVANVKMTQKLSVLDQGNKAPLEARASNDTELSSTTGNKFQINTSVYLKGNINTPVSEAPKMTINLPIGGIFYFQMTIRLDDSKIESVEAGVGLRESKPDIEFKQKSETFSKSDKLIN
jgi:RHS repeat-associated protein